VDHRYTQILIPKREGGWRPRNIWSRELLLQRCYFAEMDGGAGVVYGYCCQRVEEPKKYADSMHCSGRTYGRTVCIRAEWKNEQEAHSSGAVLAEYNEADHAGSRMDRRRQGKTRMEEPAAGAGRACARLPLLGLTTVGSRTWTCCCCRRWQGCIGSAAWRRW
jgi:hypothetical protein